MTGARDKAVQRRCFAVIGCLLCSVVAFGQDSQPAPPPASYQPADFNGAVGSFRMEALAEPTTVRSGNAITLTVRITAKQPPVAPPRRPDLGGLDAVTSHFYIQDLRERDRESRAGVCWEFVYRLKPKPGTRVEAIPAIPFVYYKPNLPPEAAYQTIRSEPIPIRVLPAAETAVVTERRQFPDELYELQTGADLLGHDQPVEWSPWFWILGLLLPPVICIGWCLAWWFRHPEGARQRRRYESAASRHALELLHLDGKDSHRTVVTVTRYLQARLGLVVVEPTPAEVVGQLRKAGVSPELANRTADFYRQWDQRRFGPSTINGQDGFGARAVQLILAIEEEQAKERVQ